MFVYFEPPCDMFDYWGIELPSSFVVPPPETKLSFVLGDKTGYLNEPEVKFGDVIYGFVEGKMVIACEVIDMVTPPEAQVVIATQEQPCYLTTVTTRVMPVRPEILYRPGLLTDDDVPIPLLEGIDNAQQEARGWGLEQLGGVAWRWWDTGLGNHILNILDDDARERRKAREALAEGLATD